MAAQHVPPRSTEELRGSSTLLAAVAIRVGPIWHNDRAGLASLPVRARRVPPDAEVRKTSPFWFPAERPLAAPQGDAGMDALTTASIAARRSPPCKGLNTTGLL